MEKSSISKLKEKVEYVLKKHPSTRNSDTNLTFTIIWEYMREEVSPKDSQGRIFISTRALKAVREDHVKRIRARFNEQGLYLPTDPEVIKQRRIKEEDWRVEMGYKTSVN